MPGRTFRELEDQAAPEGRLNRRRVSNAQIMDLVHDVSSRPIELPEELKMDQAAAAPVAPPAAQDLLAMQI